MASSKATKSIGKQAQIQCVWGHICTLSSIDQERNNISLFNVIEQINVPTGAFEMHNKEKKPVLVNHPHEIVLLFRRTIGLYISTGQIAADSKVQLVDPAGTILHETLIPFSFTEKARRFRSRIKNMGFLVTAPGDYVYRIEIKETNQESFNKLLEIPFEVVKKD